MLKAMGKMITTRSARRKGLSKGWTIEDVIGTAVCAAREVNEPDWKGMWNELKDNYGNQRACLLEIERRHGGKT